MFVLKLEDRPEIAFIAEETLGKLAKWLRILGFDTIFEPQLPGAGFSAFKSTARVCLTKTVQRYERFGSNNIILITSDRPSEQLQQVVTDLNIGPPDIHLFSRCTQCNLPTIALHKSDVLGQVPDYIWQTHNTFHGCRQCGHIFWAGSHFLHAQKIIKKLFECK